MEQEPKKGLERNTGLNLRDWKRDEEPAPQKPTRRANSRGMVTRCRIASKPIGGGESNFYSSSDKNEGEKGQGGIA